MRAVLHLADRHLHREQSEHAPARRAPAAPSRERDTRARARTRSRTPPSRARASTPRARTTRDGARPCCPDAGLPQSRACRRREGRTRRDRPAGRHAAPSAATCSARADATRRSEHDREREHDHREQEVREHPPRVQVVVHRQRAERRLRERAEEDERREPPVAAREDPGGERRQDRQERDHAVPELDVAVAALRLEVVRRAARASARSRAPSR